MRIKEISVEGLFGVFNHTIPLNQEERITIIHSPNGYGKTAILNLINYTFRGISGFEDFTQYQFKKINIKFTDNKTLTIAQDNNKKLFFCFDFDDNNKKKTYYSMEQSFGDYISEIGKIDINTLFISIERVQNQRIYQLRHSIDEKTKEYTTLTQTLERTYPSRLVERKSSFNLDTLKQKLREIEDKQRELISVGLLDEQNITSDSFIEKVDESNSIALSLYVEDMTKKLSIFEELERKVEILKEIINSRFLYKKMLISKSKGIYFVNDYGIELSFQSLSSGEQHELVLFFELLFNLKEHTIILIDEPELSLHVSWQIQFLKDLIRVAKIAKFDVLLATHSPQIINDRWDLTVELKGKDVTQTIKNGSKAVII
jgi:predicted ATP-binding protein involved in virulence